MDSYEILIKQKRYSEVLSFTEGKNDPEALFGRISALICLKEYKKAKALFDEHLNTLFVAMPLRTIDSYFEFLILMGDFDEAYAKEKWFEDQPYISQEVEEEVRKIPSIIRAGEKSSVGQKPVSEEDMHSRLRGHDDFLVLSSLAMLSAISLPSFLDDVEMILVGDRPELIKTYALLLLVSSKVDHQVKVNKNHKEIVVTPSKLSQPFSGEHYKEAKQILLSSKDPSIAKKGQELLDYALIQKYPSDLELFAGKSIAEASLALADSYIGGSKGEELKGESLKAYQEIKKLNESGSPLKL